MPRVVITDKLKSYGVALREILPGVEHRQHRYLNNRAVNSHRLTRQRERRKQGFKSPGQAQRFSRPMGRLRHTSALGVISALPPSIVKRWPNDSESGRRSRARPWLRRVPSTGSRPPLSPVPSRDGLI